MSCSCPVIFKPHTSFKSPKIYFYKSILLKCIDITIHYTYLIVDCSNKANNNIEKVLCVVGNIGLMDHVVLF